MNSQNTTQVGQRMILSFNLKGELIHTDSVANQFFGIAYTVSGDQKISNWLTDDDYLACIGMRKDLKPVHPFAFLEVKIVRSW